MNIARSLIIFLLWAQHPADAKEIKKTQLIGFACGKGYYEVTNHYSTLFGLFERKKDELKGYFAIDFVPSDRGPTYYKIKLSRKNLYIDNTGDIASENQSGVILYGGAGEDITPQPVLSEDAQFAKIIVKFEELVKSLELLNAPKALLSQSQIEKRNLLIQQESIATRRTKIKEYSKELEKERADNPLLSDDLKKCMKSILEKAETVTSDGKTGSRAPPEHEQSRGSSGSR